MESRRRYGSDEVTETYAQFTRGEPVWWDGVDAEWCAERREQATFGKRFERVRILDNPPTTGQLYLLDNARRNTAVGEVIHTLTRAEAQELRLPEEDFWLFDSRLVALLRFDDDDQLLDVELITEPATVLRYAQARDAAWHYAVPYQEAAARFGTAE